MLTRCDHTRMADRRTLSEIPGGQTTGSAQYHGVAPATARSPDFSSGTRARKESRCADEAELLQGRYAIVKTDFLEDLSILEFQHGRARKFHLAAGVGRQRSRQEVAERLPGMRSAAFPSTDDVVVFRDEIRSAPEVEIGERLPKVRHKRLDVFTAPARLVERIPDAQVRGSGG